MSGPVSGAGGGAEQRGAEERALLLSFVDRHRDLFRRKAGGLTHAQLFTAHPPTTITLGGLVKHLAYVENWWSRCVLLGEEPVEPWSNVDWVDDRDWEWRTAVDHSVDELWALWEAEVAAADAIYAATSPDDLAGRADRRTGERASARWIWVHLVEEYAQHNGHADLIRESIDGQTG